MQRTEAEYAKETRARTEKKLQRRARELGCKLKKLKPILEGIVMPDGEVLKVKPNGEIVNE